MLRSGPQPSSMDAIIRDKGGSCTPPPKQPTRRNVRRVSPKAYPMDAARPSAPSGATSPRRPRAKGRAKRAGSAPAAHHVLTPRDPEILRWIGRYGVVSTEQVARRWFHRETTGGSWTTSGAYRRVHVLETMGLLQRDHLYLRGPHILRLTLKGARLVGPGVRPARLVPATVGHALAVVDLTEELLPQFREATLVTEREIRSEQIRARRTHGRDGVVLRRVPDAMFRFASGKADAVELDYTPKTTKDIKRIAYTYDEHHPAIFKRVLWYAPRGRIVARVRATVADLGLDSFITVEEWPVQPRGGEGS